MGNPAAQGILPRLILLSTGVYGFFISIDLFTMFMFYEVALIPMYLLIGVRGSGNKNYSAMKLTLMLMGGSAFLMLGLIGIYYHSAPAGQPLTRNILLRLPERRHQPRLADIPLPDDLRGLRCARRHVPLPHGRLTATHRPPQQCRCSTQVCS